MAERHKARLILGNGASDPRDGRTPIQLDYRTGVDEPRVRLLLPRFVRDLLHVGARTLDLLEIAAYVYAADRLVSRGRSNAVEYNAWGRTLDFRIRVRDYDFWSQETVRNQLSKTLQYMTGDMEVSFSFEPGHSTAPTGMFDSDKTRAVSPGADDHIALFSGGVDSLAGALDLLTSDTGRVLLVSHESSTGVVRTQRALVESLQGQYGERVVHYRFGCQLIGQRAPEETQRSRSFLYAAIAFALCDAKGGGEFYVHENGVTSINLIRREDSGNARASRTTHPKAMRFMQDLLRIISERTITIRLPYLLKTKRDVMERVDALCPSLLSSTVSCTRTYKLSGPATHCGTCFQCVDRRLASISGRMQQRDHVGLYSHDLVMDPLLDPRARTTAVDYLRQARNFGAWTLARFENEFMSDLGELLDCVAEGSDAEQIEVIWTLLRRHGDQVRDAIRQIQDARVDVLEAPKEHSLLALVASGEHEKTEAVRLAKAIEDLLKEWIQGTGRDWRPRDEPDFNRVVGAFLRTHDSRLESEHPLESFACAGVVPDHVLESAGVIVESKYIRGKTSPSKANEGIAADLTKYPNRAFILFVVFDPDRGIVNDSRFRLDIEACGRNRVLILR